MMKHNLFCKRNEEGSASIMVILIIFTLMVFGVFALMSSYSEYKLSAKYATWVQEYYQLDQSGQELLSTINGTKLPGDVIDMTLENPTLSTKQKLSIRVLVKPMSYEIQKWKQVQNTFEIDLTEELWNGESSEGSGN